MNGWSELEHEKRISLQRFKLIYPLLINKDAYITMMGQKFEKYPHARIGFYDLDDRTEIMLDFGRQYHSKGSRTFQYESITPAVSRPNNDEVWENQVRHRAILMNETSKEFVRVKEQNKLIFKMSFYEELTPQSLTPPLKPPGEVMGHNPINAGRKLRSEPPMKVDESVVLSTNIHCHHFEPSGIERAFIHFYQESDANRRTFMWIHPVNNSNVKSFIDFLVKWNPRKFYSVDAQDLFNRSFPSKAAKSGWMGDTLVIDLSAMNPINDHVYELLESDFSTPISIPMINGRFQCVLINMIVISNSVPDQDRTPNIKWDIRKVN